MTRTVGSSGPKTLKSIRKAGLRLIYEHGYEAMSLRQLAAEVGIQVGSLYNHISTKQDLLYDLMREHLEQVLDELEETLKGVEGPVELLKRFVAFHLTYHMVRKGEVFIANSELRCLEPNHYEEIVVLRRHYEKRLIDILEAGKAAGLFATVDARVTAYGILAMLTGICTWFRPHGRLGKEQIIEVYTDFVLKGLKP